VKGKKRAGLNCTPNPSNSKRWEIYGVGGKAIERNELGTNRGVLCVGASDRSGAEKRFQRAYRRGLGAENVPSECCIRKSRGMGKNSKAGGSLLRTLGRQGGGDKGKTHHRGGWDGQNVKKLREHAPATKREGRHEVHESSSQRKGDAYRRIERQPGLASAVTQTHKEASAHEGIEREKGTRKKLRR